MDEYIKQSIDGRKNAIFAAYKVEGENAKKIEALFSEIEKLGVSCKDVGEFESKFAASPLNQKYLDLFTEIATNSTANAAAAPSGKGGTIGKMVAGGIVGGVADRAINEAKNAVLPTRAAVHQKAYDAARDIPVVGNAIDISQKASYAAHLGKVFGFGKKKKKDDKDEEN